VGDSANMHPLQHNTKKTMVQQLPFHRVLHHTQRSCMLPPLASKSRDPQLAVMRNLWRMPLGHSNCTASHSPHGVTIMQPTCMRNQPVCFSSGAAFAAQGRLLPLNTSMVMLTGPAPGGVLHL
jgi:hypothetical protein